MGLVGRVDTGNPYRVGLQGGFLSVPVEKPPAGRVTDWPSRRRFPGFASAGAGMLHQSPECAALAWSFVVGQYQPVLWEWDQAAHGVP